MDRTLMRAMIPSVHRSFLANLLGTKSVVMEVIGSSASDIKKRTIAMRAMICRTDSIVFLFFHRFLHSSFRITFSDIGAPVVLFLSLANCEFKLHKLLLSIQSNRHKCQAFRAVFPYE